MTRDSLNNLLFFLNYELNDANNFIITDSVNCVRSGNFNHGDVLCLKFNLPDDLLSAGTTSAVLWVNKNHLAIPTDNQSQANFFVYEMIQWNVPLSVDKLYGPQKVIDKGIHR